MNPQRTRYKTHKSLMKEYENWNDSFIRASSKMLNMVRHLSKVAEEGETELHFCYEEVSEHYLIEITLEQTKMKEIRVKLLDTTIKNSRGQHFVVIGMAYLYEAKKVNHSFINLPYVYFWDGKVYSYELSEWEHGNQLINYVMRVGVALRETTTPVVETEEFNEENGKREKSVKEELLQKLSLYALETKIVFKSEAIQHSFEELLKALGLVLNNYEKVDNIEDIHILNRMVNTEIKNLIMLYDKLNEPKQKQHEQRYIFVLNGMTEQVRVMLRKEESYTEKELEKQFRLMENRYMEKQTQY